MRQRLDLAISIAVLSALCAVLTWGGCGGPDLIVNGMIPFSPTSATTATPNCVAAGGACGANTDCCSGSCISPDGINLECQ